MTIDEKVAQFKAKQNRIEPVLLLIIFISYLLKEYVESRLGPLLIISTGLLSIFYFFIASYKEKEKDEDSISIFTNKLTYWSYSLGLLGVLFAINIFPGYQNMLIIGFGISFITLIIKLLIKFSIVKSKAVKIMNFLGIYSTLYYLLVLIYWFRISYIKIYN